MSVGWVFPGSVGGEEKFFSPLQSIYIPLLRNYAKAGISVGLFFANLPSFLEFPGGVGWGGEVLP